MRFLILVTLALILTACGNTKESQGQPSYDDLKAELATNHQLWLAAAPADYSYKLLKSCFCAMPNYLISIQGGEIAKVERPKYLSNDATEDDVTWEEVAKDSDTDIKSIEEVFATVLEWADYQPDELTVEFDPTYYFPAKIAINHRKGTADDETTLRVTEFTPPTAPPVESME